MMKTPLAWLQLAHEKARLLIAALGVTFAVILMLFQFGIEDSVYDSGVVLHRNLRGDLLLLNRSTESLNVTRGFSRRLPAQALALPQVARLATLSTAVGEWKNPVDGVKRTIFIIGVDSAAPPLDLPGVREHWPAVFRPETALYDARSKEEFGPIPEMLARDGVVSSELNGRPVKVRGLFAMGVSFSANATLLTGEENFRRLTDRQAGVVDLAVLTLKQGADVAQTRLALQRLYAGELKVMTREELIAQEQDWIKRELSVAFIFQMGVFIGFLVGAVIVYQILYSDVARHLPEYATLKAMGYTDRYLFGVVFKQALILSALGYAPGVLAALGLYAVTERATSLPLELKPGNALLALALTVTMCSISGFLATRKLREADPADIF